MLSRDRLLVTAALNCFAALIGRSACLRGVPFHLQTLSLG